jgi:hypothetical protein
MYDMLSYYQFEQVVLLILKNCTLKLVNWIWIMTFKKKFKEIGLLTQRKSMIDRSLKISVRRQCELLGVSRNRLEIRHRK